MAYLNGNMNIMRFVTRESEAPRYKGIFPLPIDSVGGEVSEWYLYGNKNGVGEKQIVNGNLPLDFVSDGTNLENYRIYGTAEGAGETKNLLEITATSTTTRGVTFTVNKTEGTITANGTASSSAYLNLLINAPSGNYYYSGCALGGSASTYDIFAWDNTIGERPKKWDGETNIDSDYGGTSQEIKVDSEHSMQLTIRIRSGYTCNNLVFKPMLRRAETTPDFEPFGYKIPLTVSQQGQPDKTVDIYIGDTKLLSTDYIDYETGKVVRNGTPQDPPLPLPAIETFSGTNTLDSTETLGETTITQGYTVPLDIRNLSDTNEITKAYRADINETAGATIDVDRQAGTVTINGTTNNAVAEVIFYMTLTEGDYWYSGVPNQEDNSIMAKLMNTNIRPPYEFNKWGGSEPGSDTGYGEEAVVNTSPVGYHLYFAPNHTFNNLVIKPKVQKATITTHKDIYTGSTPLTEGQSVSRDSTGIEIEVERGQSVIETTLTNKPEMIVTPDSYDKIKDLLLNTKQNDYNETQSDTITDEVTEVTQ